MKSHSDSTIVAACRDQLQIHSLDGGKVALLETAGGVLSPAPSGTVQADLYRPLRLPSILVGDNKLGGIGVSISGYESLTLRGYDVESVMLFGGDRYQNHEYLSEYFSERGVPTVVFPPPPDRLLDAADDEKALRAYYDRVSQQDNTAAALVTILERIDSRNESIRTSSTRANKSIWHPFTQHKGRKPEDIMTIDSAYGDYFQVHRHPIDDGTSKSSPQSTLRPLFDGSASWWTQGLGHGNPKLSMAAAYAAGRYGHVMFAGAVHEPALTLAEVLLDNMQNPLLEKVFFTDNGSTGMEAAIKMALRASAQRYKRRDHEDVLVLGLKGSYHGDTMGVMNSSEPSPYNQKVDWYRPAGCWLDVPQVMMKEGRWIVKLPDTMSDKGSGELSFSSLDRLFDFRGREDIYTAYIRQILTRLVKEEGKVFGALLMEPIVMGAGGMIFV